MSKVQRDQLNEDFRTALAAVMTDLNAANALTVPTMSQQQSLKYVTDTIVAHKKWAAAQRSKFEAYFGTPPDLDAAKKYVMEANNLAAQWPQHWRFLTRA
jgi:hypothetical protein